MREMTEMRKKKIMKREKTKETGQNRKKQKEKELKNKQM